MFFQALVSISDLSLVDEGLDFGLQFRLHFGVQLFQGLFDLQ